ncbi:transcriptional regulator, TetR family [Frankineae bacterium MT45]|nr:transcriptional regulator, TetR family [Frankineae bacterium MT45]
MTTTSGTALNPRSPSQDRSRLTRQNLLEAAGDCLCEIGWTRTTVSLVAERAGVSRGAAQHHFPTREELFTAVVEYLADQRTAEMAEEVTQLPPGAERTEAVVQMLVRSYTGRTFRAALQIWVAAASDEVLRAQIVPLEARMGAAAHQAAIQLLGVDERLPGVRETVQGILDMARGLALANLLTDDSRRRARVVRQWSKLLQEALHDAALPDPQPGAAS